MTDSKKPQHPILNFPGLERQQRETDKEMIRKGLMPARYPLTLALNTVQPEPIRWLWPAYIALGKLTLVAGDPGLGKSMLSIALAAHVTTGSPWPVDGAECLQGAVLMLSAEDDPADTIRPRMDAAGADVGKVTILQAVEETAKDGEKVRRSFDLSSDLEALDYALDGIPDCRLVIVDPISAYLGGTDSHKNAEIRALLTPLSEIATKRGVAVLAITHLNKGQHSNAMYRATGSLAFVAAARAVFTIVKDNDDPQRRLFLPVKNNLGDDQHGFAYQVEEMENEAPAVVWEPDAVDVPADEAMADGAGEDKTGEAMDFLLRELAGGRVEINTLKSLAKNARYAWRTIRRASDELSIVKEKVGFKNANWYWSLPPGTTTPEEGQPRSCQNPVPTFGQLRETSRKQKAEGGAETPETPEVVHQYGHRETDNFEGGKNCLGCVYFSWQTMTSARGEEGPCEKLDITTYGGHVCDQFEPKP